MIFCQIVVKSGVISLIICQRAKNVGFVTKPSYILIKQVVFT